MTATTERAVTHPTWCEDQNCVVDSAPWHRGGYTTWQTEGGYAEISLCLTRADDGGGSDVQVIGETRICLGLNNIEAVNSFADAYLGREDARLLIMFLQRHVEELDRRQWDRPRSEADDA